MFLYTRKARDGFFESDDNTGRKKTKPLRLAVINNLNGSTNFSKRQNLVFFAATKSNNFMKNIVQFGK